MDLLAPKGAYCPIKLNELPETRIQLRRQGSSGTIENQNKELTQIQSSP